MKTMKNLAMLIVILFPASVKKLPNARGYCQEISHFFDEIKDSCYEIFRENNIKKRLLFFSNPLVKFLWGFFISFKPLILINHFRRCRSFPYEGETRFQSLFQDMLDLEARMHF